MKVNTLAVALALSCATASATEIIYTPINPTFGGTHSMAHIFYQRLMHKMITPKVAMNVIL